MGSKAFGGRSGGLGVGLLIEKINDMHLKINYFRDFAMHAVKKDKDLSYFHVLEEKYFKRPAI